MSVHKQLFKPYMYCLQQFIDREGFMFFNANTEFTNVLFHSQRVIFVEAGGIYGCVWA